MKKIILFPILMLIASLAYAQKPVKGDMGFTLGIEGINTVNVVTDPTLLYRYYLDDDLALRVKVDATFTSDKTDYSDTSGAGEHDITKTHEVSLNIGLQKDFGKSLKRLQPYITGELMLGMGKSGISDNTTDYSDTESIRVVTDPGNTFSIGLISNVGFNYFFADHFAVGAEFGYGLTYSKTAESSIETTVVTGNTSTVTTSTGASAKSLGLSGTGGIGTITVSVFFGD